MRFSPGVLTVSFDDHSRKFSTQGVQMWLYGHHFAADGGVHGHRDISLSLANLLTGFNLISHGDDGLCRSPGVLVEGYDHP